ncbi:dihydrofolate reductase family protein [Pseudonocardia bannensis]|uniref:GTP cyclohydrolase II n=1 Tax=Pseudonocardia bannensis TaxID=630973 RepID=A0A848DH34_9PSEU|nr:dihydrofolate reductase family protein [Pseudonocardia bannensis]NMH91865.1 GTP cyclohydrolase II [Pseudonocardia bannensis]
MNDVRELVRVVLPTQFGEFEVTAFEARTGLVHLALAKGELVGGGALTRLHPQCPTGDAPGSLCCECAAQLRLALRRIAADGLGLLLYATGQEGRGVELVDELRASLEQDDGADTVEAGPRLGRPGDGHCYDAAAAVLHALGIGSVRLLTNNPDEERGLRAAGITVEGTEPLGTAAHSRDGGIPRTQERRLGHLDTAGEELEAAPSPQPDAIRLLGDVDPPADRPYVVLKYAQTLDGRIATADGDSKWISGEEERAVSHALRAACDAVMVGVGTVLRDDPRLTVRLVPGASPLRVVLDSTLRTPSSALLLDGNPVTVVLTTDRAAEDDRKRMRETGAGVRVLPTGPGGVDLVAGLRVLRECGVRSLLVEGGARVITSLLSAGLVDRIVVGTAAKIIGAGKEAVGDLGVARVAEGISLRNRYVHLTADDIVTAWDVCGPRRIRSG